MQPRMMPTAAEPTPGREYDLVLRRLLVLAVLTSLCLAAIAARNRNPWSDEGWFSRSRSVKLWTAWIHNWTC